MAKRPFVPPCSRRPTTPRPAFASAAIGGLARLNRDDKAETILRAAWSNSKEAYGARKHALRGLVAWKVKDADELLAKALEVSADHHSIAATALELMLETPGAKARELAALYSKYGQPESLRSTAIGAFSRLAKDDPALQDILIELADDRDRSVRFQAWHAVRDLGVKKALPILEARLARESADFGGNTRRVLKEAIETLKADKSADAKQAAPASSNPATASARPRRRPRRARAPGCRTRAEIQGTEIPDRGAEARAGAGGRAGEEHRRNDGHPLGALSVRGRGRDHRIAKIC